MTLDGLTVSTSMCILINQNLLNMLFNSALNRKLKILFIVSFFFYFASFAQQIKIRIDNAPQKAVLLEIEGENSNEIDTVFVTGSEFLFSLSGKHPGIYRLKFDNLRFLNFINDGKDVELKTNFNNIADSLQIINSESNKLFLEFLKLNKSFKTKTELLNVILQRFPEDDDYYDVTLKKFEELKYDYSFFATADG